MLIAGDVSQCALASQETEERCDVACYASGCSVVGEDEFSDVGGQAQATLSGTAFGDSTQRRVRSKLVGFFMPTLQPIGHHTQQIVEQKQSSS